MKICSKCLIDKDFSDFYLKYNKYRSQCKQCFNKAIKKSKEIKNLPENLPKIKICIKCGIDKNIELFSKTRNTCLECHRSYHNNLRKRYNYKKPKVKKSITMKPNKPFKLTEEEKILKNKKQNDRRNNRIKNDPIYKTKEQIRKLVYKSFRIVGFKKTSRTYEILGCTYEEFKIYIESKFEPWMTWENHGNYTGNYNETWQYDHIVPLSSAKTEAEVLSLNHYTNFQPLCSKKNLVDKNRKLKYNI